MRNNKVIKSQNKINLFLIFLFISISNLGFGQFNINNKIEYDAKTIKSIDTLKRVDTRFSPLNDAYLKNQIRAIRKERNKFETENSLYFTQYSYRNWAPGGENTFNGRLTSHMKHTYTVNRFDVTTLWDAAYAMGTRDSVLWKTEDRFQINTALNYRFSNHLYYNFNIDFKSQFANGYNNKNDTVPSSRFLAPATLVLGLGLNYKLDKERSFTFSPISGSMTMVTDKRLSDMGAFGVEQGKKTKLQFGASVRAAWKQPLVKDTKKINGGTSDVLTYRILMSSFWDYQNTPNLYWQNWLDLVVYRYFSVNLNWTLNFDSKVITPNGGFWQFSQVLGIGVKYKITN